MSKMLISKNFVKSLLLVEILRDTTEDTPKNTTQILEEFKVRWEKIFPDSQDDEGTITQTTIIRHVNDLKNSGIYDIRTHKNKKLGYYNATGSVNGRNFIFTPEEFAVIAMALFRTPSISLSETQKILAKFENLVDTLGKSFHYLLKQQVKHCKGFLRKAEHDTGITLREILQSIIYGKKIRFKLYDPTYNFLKNSAPQFLKLKKNLGIRDKIFTVSPYNVSWDNDECYLIAYDQKTDTAERRRLSHFKISQIANVKMTDEEIVPIEEISEIARYSQSSGTFSWNQYQIEHLNMAHDNSELLNFTIYFKEEFLQKFLSCFGLNAKYEKISNRSATEKMKFQAVITVPESEGIYQWLMQNSCEVKVVSPKKLRENLIERHIQALKDLKAA